MVQPASMMAIRTVLGMSSQTEETGQFASHDSSMVMLGDRYRIHPDLPLADLGSPGVPAFSATDERGTPKTLFALICRRELPARTDILAQFARFRRLPMLSLLRSGVTYWPPAHARRFVLILEQPGGERLMADAQSSIEPWREDRVVRTVMQPLMPLFKELSQRMLTHRSIRADNLFFADASQDAVVLGECFSGPPAHNQPAYYEPIDGAMAMPEGRGAGTPADDLYALGVLILALLVGGNPVADVDEEEVIQTKITRGSYAALVRDARLSLPMVEVLRGLLCDDPDQRWRYDDLNMWLNGRHLSPKQALLPQKAARAFTFENKEFSNAPALSQAMGHNWAKALDVIKSNDLERWVRRSLGDDLRADAVRNSTQAAIGGGAVRGSGEDRVLSRVLMSLDHRAPLRYKLVSARVDGLAQAFAYNYNDAEKRQIFAEIFAQRLPQMWIEKQPALRPELVILRRIFDSVSYNLAKARIGFGLERALYSSNPAWPCQSPLLSKDYVSELSELLPALERLAREGKTERAPVDSHIAGFVSAKTKASIEQALRELTNPEDPASFNRGALRLLADVQRTAGPAATPYLAGWCAALLKPAIEDYRNRTRRQQMAEMTQQLAAKGNLTALLTLVDDPNRRAADEQGFRDAKVEFASLVEQANWLRGGGMTSPAIVRRHAREASSITSAVISGVALLGITLASVF